MRYNKSAQQVLTFFKTGSEAPSYKGLSLWKVLIMILFNDKMYSKVIIIIKKGWCMSMVYALVAGTVAVYAVIAKYVLNGVGTAKWVILHKIPFICKKNERDFLFLMRICWKFSMIVKWNGNQWGDVSPVDCELANSGQKYIHLG